MQGLSISNIAWSADETIEVLKLMRDSGFTGLEIAPTAIWGDITAVRESDLISFRETVNGFGIKVVAMQSLLYGHPEMTIFGDKEIREKTLGHLKRCVDIGEVLGIKAYVFGSPKNRCLPVPATREHYAIAEQFFDAIGTYARDHDGLFCLEPNPTEYGTNFLTTTGEALRFVRATNNDGLKVNVDTGTIIANHEDPEHVLAGNLGYVGHVHVSEPFLGQISRERPEHVAIARLLKREAYPGYVSIEMKRLSEDSNLGHIREALSFVSGLYL